MEPKPANCSRFGSEILFRMDCSTTKPKPLTVFRNQTDVVTHGLPGGMNLDRPAVQGDFSACMPSEQTENGRDQFPFVPIPISPETPKISPFRRLEMAVP